MEIADTFWATEIGDGSGRDPGELGDSCILEEIAGARGGGGGIGAAVAEGRSRFVVIATDMSTGGGVIGAVCIMVI